MALVANNVRFGGNPLRQHSLNTTIALQAHAGVVRAGFSKDGKARNFWASEAGIDDMTAIPAGARHPAAWRMAPTAGGLSSHNATDITVSPAGTAVLGLPASGSTTLTFTVTGTGGLIVSGTGSATITFSPTGTILSVAAGSGSATIDVSATALIGALAGLQAQSTITLSPAALISAVGYLAGESTNETEFSADVLAAAVWSALASDFNLAGTMGEKLNGAGSAGDPWSTALPGVYAAGTAGDKLSKALSLAKFIGLK